MCGIIAVVRRPSDRQPPELAGLLDTVERVAAVIPSADPGGGGTPRQAGDGWDATRSRLDEAGKALDGVDRELHGAAGLACLLADPDGRARLDRLAAELERRVERLEAAIDLEAADVAGLLAERVRDPLYTSGAVRAPGGQLGFVYKAASEVGELGDNTRRLRAAIAGDELLRRALERPEARALVLGHTRWATVGLINQANAHPLNQEQEHEEDGDPIERPYAVAVLNGDVDNYLELVASHGLRIPGEITTDAKVIPVLLARRLESGLDPAEAFRRTVSELDGSVAIAAHTVAAPGQLLLALRGSGQSLNVGLTEDAFLVASEPYGLVAETDTYIRMDGEATAVEADGTAGVKGQIVVL